MQFAHGKTWRLSRLVEIKPISINPQAIVPATGSGVKAVVSAVDEGVAAAVETATFEDAEGRQHPIQSLQSERRQPGDVGVDGVNPSADRADEEPGRAGAPQARRDEARQEDTRRAEGDKKVEAEAKEGEDRRALQGVEREARAPEIADPPRLTQKWPLWIQEANVKKQLRRRVNWA